MKLRYISSLLVLLFSAVAASGADAGPISTDHMTEKTRMDLIRGFNSELVYIRTPFPMGKKGLTLKGGLISPSGEELRQMIAMWGPSVKPGDRAMITQILIRGDRIHFEINGGPVKKMKWYQHISVGSGTADVPIAPGSPQDNPRGSYVDLVFDHYIPDLNPQQLKNLLYPVFDFDSKSPLQAYLETVPPKVKEAILAHRVLVGMNREMVICAKGRAAQKTREKDGDTEYEEWIYGQPPNDVDFVRFVGDDVIRVETMKVTGEKIIRTEKEVDLDTSVAKADTSPENRPANAPTLRRPGEEAPDAPNPGAPIPLPPVSPTDTQPPPGPNLNWRPAQWSDVGRIPLFAKWLSLL